MVFKAETTPTVLTIHVIGETTEATFGISGISSEDNRSFKIENGVNHSQSFVNDGVWNVSSVNVEPIRIVYDSNIVDQFMRVTLVGWIATLTLIGFLAFWNRYRRLTYHSKH